MPGLFFVKDSDFKVVKANQHFLSLYPESKRDKVIGYTTVEDYPQEDAERFLADDKRAFELGFVDTHEAIHFPDGRRRLLYTQKNALLTLMVKILFWPSAVMRQSVRS